MGRIRDTDKDKVECGKRLQKYRENRRFTQDKLAEQTGISRETISRYETGQSNMSIIRLTKLCKVLKVSIDVILGNAPASLSDDDSTEKKAEEDEVSTVVSGISPESKRELLKMVCSVYVYMKHMDKRA